MPIWPFTSTFLINLNLSHQDSTFKDQLTFQDNSFCFIAIQSPSPPPIHYRALKKKKEKKYVFKKEIRETGEGEQEIKAKQPSFNLYPKVLN